MPGNIKIAVSIQAAAIFFMDFKLKQQLNHSRIKNLRDRATSAELEMCNILNSHGVEYIFQKGFIKGDAFVIVDFYIKKSKTCLEVDGEYHQTAKQMDYDRWKDAYLNSRGFKVIRIKNRDVKSFVPSQAC